MPTSDWGQIGSIVHVLKLLNPMSVLDIGVGFGKYGVLAREYLELWGAEAQYGEWKRRIDGLEAHAGYITPLHRYVYDNIYIGDASALLPTLTTRYDVVLLIDVIEHFAKADGKQVLAQCCEKARNVIVSTPKRPGDQGQLFGNDYETHKSRWDPRSLAQGRKHFLVPDSGSWILVIGEDAARIGRWYRYERVARLSPMAASLLLQLYRAGQRFKKGGHRTERRSSNETMPR